MTISRAEAASTDKLNGYYKELSSIMTKLNVRQNPVKKIITNKIKLESLLYTVHLKLYGAMI